MRSRILAAAIVLAGGFAAAGVDAQQGNTISVVVSGMRDNTGSVRCGLFNSAATFPKSGQEIKGVEAPIANLTATCTFTDVPPGTYAVAYFKAAPVQTKMNTGMLGMPQRMFQIANFTSAFVWAGVLLLFGDVVSKVIGWIFGGTIPGL